MFYFIPAWYQKQRPWYHTTELWFRTYERMTFDDTVNHYKIFEKAGEETCLLILNYQPQLRYALHKQDMVGAVVWSLFDDIQNVHEQTMTPINFKHLKWPQGIRFVYSPFAIVAKQGQETYAVIHFTENGNLFYIETYSEKKTDKIYYFDDRGFLSSLIYYSDGVAQYQDYLNKNGVWQVRESLQGEFKISVNPDADQDFDQTEYRSWEKLIDERLRKFKVRNVTNRDIFISAADPQHNNLILNVFVQNKKGFSFFGNRYQWQTSRDLIPLFLQADLLIVDTQEQEKKLRHALIGAGFTKLLGKLSRISPFDTRLRLGHSQTVKELKIYFFIDTISEQELRTYLPAILDMMEENSAIHLELVNFRQDYDLKGLETYLKNLIWQNYTVEAFLKVADDGSENHIDESTKTKFSRLAINRYTNENQVITTLDTTRLVIDLGENPDLYTQIASISAGIPQINRVQTDYIDHMKNGWILSDGDDLRHPIHYYFDGLTNWNQSLVYAIEKMSDYTSGRILTQWKSVLNLGEG